MDSSFPFERVTAAYDADIRRDTQEAEQDPVAVWPTLAPAALTGLAGDVVRLATASSEADPASVLVTFLTAFGAACGRSTWLKVGDTDHHPRLFAALVGSSSRARKGTSAQPVRRVLTDAETILQRTTPVFPGGTAGLHVSDGPLSSGEGLIWAIRDESEDQDKDGQPVTAGVKDKRLLVIEGELGGALRVAGREGSSLSAILRSAWDGGRLRPLVSGRSKAVVGASDPHICFVGHVTQAELDAVLSEVDVFNGLANRVLWCCARRGTPRPFPRPMPDEAVNDLAARVAGALAVAHRGGQASLSPDAMAAWEQVYPALTKDEPGAFGAATARAEAQTLRLALTFALLDGSLEIQGSHLIQAIAVWRYCLDSARYLFGGRSVDRTAEKVAKIVTEAGADGITQTKLYTDLGKHVKSSRLAAILAELQAAGRVSQTITETPGRPIITWRAGRG